MSIFEVVGRWLDALEVEGASPSTLRAYGDGLLRAGRLRRKDPRTFSPDDVVAVLKSYDRQAPARVQMLRALRSFYRFAESRELSGNPAAGVRVRSPSEPVVPALSPTEIRSLLRAAFHKDQRRGWTIALLYATGARIGSLAAVGAKDVQDGHITFRVMKGLRGSHEVPLSRLGRIAAEHLRTCPHKRAPRPTLVGVSASTIWAWVRQASRASGVELDGRPVWPHLLRHTAATVAYEATKDPLGVSEFLGHKDPRYAYRYVARSDGRKHRMAEAVGG